MRKLMLIVMALTLAVTQTIGLQGGNAAMAAESAQSHRSQYTKQHKAGKAAANNDVHAIDAFSDTTSAASNAQDSASTSAANASSIDSYIDSPFYDNDSDFEKFIGAFMSYGTVAGILIAIIGSLFVICLCLLPFLVIILPIVYLIKKNNSKMRLAEKMIENGVPLTDENSPFKTTNEGGMQYGIRQAAIGVGLIIMGWILDMEILMAVAFLVLALGVGKIISAKVAGKREKEEEVVVEEATEE